MINPNKLTPIEKHGNIYFKREDLFEVGGLTGAKVRACYLLALQAKEQGFETLTSLGAKGSPQINILASVAKVLEMKAVGHTTTAKLQFDMLQAKKKGATIIQHPYGYTSVLIKRAKDYAKENNAFYVPFGMDDITSVNATIEQVKSVLPIKDKINRIVVPLGSGINICGIILGLQKLGLEIPVIGVEVGHKADKTLCKYLGEDFASFFTKEVATQDYNKNAEFTIVNGIHVDSTYEGKCLPFLQPNDLFWVVGKKGNYVQGKELKI